MQPRPTNIAAFLASTILSLLATSSLAHASSAVVVMGGTANDRDGAHVRAAVESSIRDAGWSVAAKPPTKPEVAAVLGCKDAQTPWTCVPASIASSGVSNVLVVRVDNQRSDAGAPMLVLNGQIIALDSKSIASGSQYCEQCADDKLAQAASELTAQLLRDIAVRTGHTMIDIRTTPPGAQVTLDGNPVGVTDRTFTTFPGKHVVIIEKPGFERVVEDVTVEEGTTAAVTHTLKAASVSTPPPTTAKRRSRIPPVIAISAGAIMLVGGTYVSWTADSPDTGPQDKYLYSGPGIAVAVLGAVAIGAGIYFWPHAPKATTSTPTVSIVRDGAIAGWATSF